VQASRPTSKIARTSARYQNLAVAAPFPYA
jgi:hypothetical protein